MDFSAITGVITDMDGVLWRGDVPLPGLIPFFDLLRAKNIPLALATNNGGKSPSDYVTKLARLGVPGILPEQIVTSGTASLDYLRVHFAEGTPVHVLGGDGLRQVMRDGGYPVVDTYEAKAVLVGLDQQLTYEKLKRAALILREGAAFIATNEDHTYPSPEGLAPGAGSLVAALKVSTDRQPTAIIGKPHAPMFEAALRVVGSPPGNTLMIGDRLNTDIEGAARLGLKTALVLTGVSTRAEAEAAATKPDVIFDDLAALVAGWG
jgi:4-nitrophenyl phosphatase